MSVVHNACRFTYQDADDPAHYLMYTAWDSPTAWERFQQERAPAIRAALAARGVTTEPFLGRTHADADRYGVGGS